MYTPCTHTNARARAHTHTHTHAPTHTYTHTRTRTRPHSHTHTHTHARMHARTRTRAHAHTHTTQANKNHPRTHTHSHTHTTAVTRLGHNSLRHCVRTTPHSRQSVQRRTTSVLHFTGRGVHIVESEPCLSEAELSVSPKEADLANGDGGVSN